jgi:hypothetical protein
MDENTAHYEEYLLLAQQNMVGAPRRAAWSLMHSSSNLASLMRSCHFGHL